jgi:hypothetical protein
MHKSFLVDDTTEIDAYVCHATLLHDGTRVYRFSKEILAFLKTLMAFMSLLRWQRPQRSRPHGQLIRGGPQGLRSCDLRGSPQLLDRGAPLLVRFITAFGGGGVANVDEAAASVEVREGDVVRVETVRVDTLPPPSTFKMNFQSAAENEAAIATAAAAASVAPAESAATAPVPDSDPVAAAKE